MVKLLVCTVTTKTAKALLPSYLVLLYHLPAAPLGAAASRLTFGLRQMSPLRTAAQERPVVVQVHRRD
jgi:hypothetical protein